MAQYNTKNKSSRVSKRWFSDIDINFTLHPESSDILMKYDINAIKRSLKNLLSTNVYERPFKPSLGVNLRGLLFELDNGETKLLRNEIKNVIEKFEPRCVIKGIDSRVSHNTMNITLFFNIRNNSRNHKLDLVLQRVR
jgi:phage baseplate assembly protein W